MRYLETKQQSAELVRLVLPLMECQTAAYHPVSYALWYEHAAGLNPALSAALSARLAANDPLSEEDAYRLYAQHISDRDAAVLDNLQQRLELLLTDTAQTVSGVKEDSGRFRQNLQMSRSDLKEDATVAALREVVCRLLSEALRMEAATQAFSEKLDARAQEVRTLTEQLRRAQTEAVLDPLCGINNRRGLLCAVEAMGDADNGLVGAALVLADVDHFKRINDSFGHLLGDKVLQTIAGVLRANIKGRDIVARIGGEEFALLLPRTTLQGATALAEQIRAAIECGRIYRNRSGETIGTVTMSFGLAVGIPGETIDQLMTRADGALYAAKRSGRNRVCAAQ